MGIDVGARGEAPLEGREDGAVRRGFQHRLDDAGHFEGSILGRPQDESGEGGPEPVRPRGPGRLLEACDQCHSRCALRTSTPGHCGGYSYSYQR